MFPSDTPTDVSNVRTIRDYQQLVKVENCLLSDADSRLIEFNRKAFYSYSLAFFGIGQPWHALLAVQPLR